MKPNLLHWLPLLCLISLIPAGSLGQQTVQVQAAKTTAAKPVSKVSPGTQYFYGSLAISTPSKQARQNLEMALDQYENAGFDQAILHAQLATNSDPRFALAYALWAFAARRTAPAPEVLAKAKALAPKCTRDECLLITFMNGTQDANVLPAISAMNDLLMRRPKDKHVLYLAGEWLFFQGNYGRAMEIWSKALALDPEFPAALNMLGYSYVESGDPDPQKAVGYLKHYAAVLPNEANPQDSLGEVLRMVGDDSGSLAHYAEALRISPTFITSQYGRGDTYTLMGNLTQARLEYETALKMASTAHDRLHIQFQKALANFWDSDPKTGRAELARLSESAAADKDEVARFEIDYARALLSPDHDSEQQLLNALNTRFLIAVPGLLDADRNAALAQVLREEVRLAAAYKQKKATEAALDQLLHLSESSREMLVESILESARGYAAYANDDFTKAAEQFSADLHSPLVVQQLALTEEKLGSEKGVQEAQTRLKYLRTPTAEWYVASHNAALQAQTSRPE
jgi:tetratricopeptide (TPR) repeat protein